MKNYYEILEVNEMASIEVIDRAYKVLVRRYHPDLHGEETHFNYERKLKDLNEAYDVLSNQVLRDQYDRELENYEYEKMTSIREKHDKRKKTEKEQEEVVYENTKAQRNTYKVGTMGSMMDLTKEIFSNRPRFNKKEKFNKKTGIALGLSILIVVILCVILWFIPFTNSFVRDLTVNNPLISWMFK